MSSTSCSWFCFPGGTSLGHENKPLDKTDKRDGTYLLAKISTAPTCTFPVSPPHDKAIRCSTMHKLTESFLTVMSFVTYILLSTLIAGLKGQFKPELLGYTATTGMVVVIVELVALKLGTYLLSISSQSQLLDLIAYSGYKFVGIIVTIVVAEILNGGKGTGGWGWGVFLYTFLANSLFLVSAVLSHPIAGNLYLTTLHLDAIATICPTSRNVRQHWRTYADRLTGQAKPENPVPLLLLVHCSALLHVDTHTRYIKAWA